MKPTFWDDRFQRQVEILQQGPKKPWQYYIPKGCGRPERDISINTDDIIRLHFILATTESIDELCEKL